jgi:hypothetical protein
LVTFRIADKEKEEFANFVISLEGNTVIDLNSEAEANGLYGLKKKFKRVSLFMDDKEAFLEELKKRKSD